MAERAPKAYALWAFMDWREKSWYSPELIFENWEISMVVDDSWDYSDCPQLPRLYTELFPATAENISYVRAARRLIERVDSSYKHIRGVLERYIAQKGRRCEATFRHGRVLMCRQDDSSQTYWLTARGVQSLIEHEFNSDEEGLEIAKGLAESWSSVTEGMLEIFQETLEMLDDALGWKSEIVDQKFRIVDRNDPERERWLFISPSELCLENFQLLMSTI